MALCEAPPCSSWVGDNTWPLEPTTSLEGGDRRLGPSLGPTHVKIGSITSQAAYPALVALAHTTHDTGVLTSSRQQLVSSTRAQMDGRVIRRTAKAGEVLVSMPLSLYLCDNWQLIASF